MFTNKRLNKEGKRPGPAINTPLCKLRAVFDDRKFPFYYNSNFKLIQN